MTVNLTLRQCLDPLEHSFDFKPNLKKMSKPDFHFCVGNLHFKLCHGTASIYFYWCGGGLVRWYMYVCMSRHMCGHQRIALRSGFSPLWVLGIELMSSGLHCKFLCVLAISQMPLFIRSLRGLVPVQGSVHIPRGGCGLCPLQCSLVWCG